MLLLLLVYICVCLRALMITSLGEAVNPVRVCCGNPTEPSVQQQPLESGAAWRTLLDLVAKPQSDLLKAQLF